MQLTASRLRHLSLTTGNSVVCSYMWTAATTVSRTLVNRSFFFFFTNHTYLGGWSITPMHRELVTVSHWSLLCPHNPALTRTLCCEGSRSGQLSLSLAERLSRVPVQACEQILTLLSQPCPSLDRFMMSPKKRVTGVQNILHSCDPQLWLYFFNIGWTTTGIRIPWSLESGVCG